MPNKRAVDDVLSKDAVSNVHPETPRERVFRVLVADIERVAAFTIVVVGNQVGGDLQSPLHL